MVNMGIVKHLQQTILPLIFDRCRRPRHSKSCITMLVFRAYAQLPYKNDETQGIRNTVRDYFGRVVRLKEGLGRR